MKVILLKDVPGVGQKHETREVTNGYGRNVLLAKKLALLATPKTEKTYTTLRAQKSSTDKLEGELLAKNFAALAESPIEIMVEANEEGSLYAGLHAKEIAEEIEKQKRLKIPVEAIILEKPLKHLGEHSLKLKSDDLEGEIKIILSNKK